MRAHIRGQACTRQRHKGKLLTKAFEAKKHHITVVAMTVMQGPPQLGIDFTAVRSNCGGKNGDLRNVTRALLLVSFH